MKNSANSNMYEVTAEDILTVYGPLLDGAPTATFMVVSTRPLGATARDALEKSATALGYGEGALIWAVTVLDDEGLEAGATDLLSMIEGLDPLAVVLADEHAITLAESAYRTTLERDNLGRLMGRNAVAFADLEALLETPAADGKPAGKAVVWNRLKALRLS